MPKVFIIVKSNNPHYSTEIADEIHMRLDQLGYAGTYKNGNTTKSATKVDSRGLYEIVTNKED